MFHVCFSSLFLFLPLTRSPRAGNSPVLLAAAQDLAQSLQFSRIQDMLIEVVDPLGFQNFFLDSHLVSC